MKTTFQRPFTYAVLVALSAALVACSGSKPPEKEKKPPQAGSPAGQQALPQLEKLAEEAKQVCCYTYGNYMIQYSTSPGAQTGDPTQTPAMPNSDPCKQAIMNFETYFRTIDNGAYANTQPAQDWRHDQGVQTVQCVGDMMAASGLPTDPGSIPNYYAPAFMISQDLASSVPNAGSYLSAIPSGPVPVGGRPVPPELLAASQGQAPFYPFGSNTQVMPYLPSIPTEPGI